MDKFFATSKTIQGIIVMAVPMLRALFGWEWATPEAGADVSMIVDGFITLVGLVWAFYGRMTAEKKLTLTP